MSEYKLMTNEQINQENKDTAKLELYRLIGEGYKAMQENRTSSMQEVKQKLKNRRKADG